MAFFRDLPIRRKLALLSLVTSMVALVVACGSLITFEQFAFRRTLTRDLAISAEMIASNSASALAFDDVQSAEQTLKALLAQPRIVAASVYNVRGAVFAVYVRPGSVAPVWPGPQENSHRFTSNSLQLFRKITLGPEVLGTIYVESDLQEVGERLRRYAVVVGAVMCAAILAAYFIGRRLQSIISEPISVLTGAMANVAMGKQRRAVPTGKWGNDELGQLISGFNQMLSQIEAREADLRRVHAELETRVEERTRELVVQIAERQRTEEERDRFFTLSLDLLCIASFDGAIRRANPAFDALLQLSMPALQQTNFIDLLHPDERERMRFEIRRIAGGRPLIDFETRVCCADGSIRWFAWSCKAAPEGQCFYAYGRDITERKGAEAERASLHSQLLEISRQAGMAEVATSVLHNVGNVLNSVNVSATLVLDGVRDSRVGLVAQISDLLQQHEATLTTFMTDDPRGRQLPRFMRTLADSLMAERASVMAEVQLLQKNVDHINEIVAMQQDYARVSGVTETVALADLVNDAVQMNAGALERHGVELVRDYQQQPTITVEKHKLLQILVNLIRNAKYACGESGQVSKRIILRITADEKHAKMSVVDNGVGIPAENLLRIFNHGFTTRKEGHGFGLHSGALIVQELGGSIRVASDGWGRGAEFTVELPLNRAGIP